MILTTFNDNIPLNSLDKSDGQSTPQVVIIAPTRKFAEEIQDYCLELCGSLVETVLAFATTPMHLMLSADVVIS